MVAPQKGILKVPECLYILIGTHKIQNEKILTIGT